MKRLLYYYLVALVVAVADLAHGGVVLDGGGLVLAQQGGTIDSSGLGDLALAGTPFALDEHAAAAHAIVHLNDGIFGNTNSWIGGGSVGTSGPFAGISLGAATSTVQSIAFGRDGGGEETTYTDRWGPGVYTLQYTQVANPGATTSDADWTTVGTLDYQSAGGPGFDQPWLRHRYNFDPVEATGVRLMVANTAVCIDEVGHLVATQLPHRSQIGDSLRVLPVVEAGAKTEAVGVAQLHVSAELSSKEVGVL